MQCCVLCMTVHLNPSTRIDQGLIRHSAVALWGCRIAPTGRLNVKGGMYWLRKVNMGSLYLHISLYLASCDRRQNFALRCFMMAVGKLLDVVSFLCMSSILGMYVRVRTWRVACCSIFSVLGDAYFLICDL